MGITVPMRILITDSHVAEDPVVKEALEKLTKQGHEIIIDDTYQRFDFICGGNCWYMKPELANLFTFAVANARRIAHADQERVNQVKHTQHAKRKSTQPRKGSTTKRVPPEPVGEIEGGC